MSLESEREWAGRVSALKFVLENLLAGIMRPDGSVAAKEYGDGILGQWKNSTMRPHPGLSRLDAASIHLAGAKEIEGIFATVVERIEQEEARGADHDTQPDSP